ncbi:hypothetical protein MUN82_08205 [Hymenobacter aerilatus]|uniref:Uncharacterized protein n=1 Tax=Hymenobacter aerilatus TaxID=2932251 RepID=A0A8T9T5D2_9BACT|nr:hypothetical protein [Hymenobacter aerilatus]UOR07069.1 hypothetical protein MUN82_08205 [Hymenobacter aerilatus]
MRRFLQQLFGSATTACQAEWRPLARTRAQQESYARWVQQRVYLNWMGPFFKAYHFQKTNVRGQGLRVQLLSECGRQGALFFYDPSIGPGNFQHLFDFIRDRVLALGYHLSTSDCRRRPHAEYTETIEKHFLKPTPGDCPETGRCNQRFGNVTVDLVRINNQPGFIRFVSNPYHDNIFSPAHTFDELLDAVFNLPAASATEQASAKQFQK